MESEAGNDIFHFQVALGAFQKRLELRVPLRHFGEFYEEAKLKEVLRHERSKIGSMFIPKLNSEEEGGTDLTLELLSAMEKVSDEYVIKNRENRQKSKELMEKFMDLLCEMLKASVEAHLSLEQEPTDMELETDSLRKLLQMKIAGVMRGFKSSWIWKPGDSEFQQKQNLKLKERLENVAVDAPDPHGICDSPLSLNQLREDTKPKPVRKQQERSKKIAIPIPSHISIMKGEPRMYKCNVCHKVFRWKHHIPSHNVCVGGEKFFKCHHCGKSFNFQLNLTAHMRIHTGEKPYTCGKCGQSFTNVSSLRNHKIRKHTLKFPFRCNHCDRGFVDRTNLYLHLCTHTGERPLKCPFCSRAVCRRDNLLRHIEDRHGVLKDVARNLVESAVQDYRKELANKRAAVKIEVCKEEW